MVPTLIGRVQTRLFTLAVVGGLVTLVVTPLLPGTAPLGRKYAASFTVLGLVALLGLGWEVLYHGLQQFRWEKDWPTLFGLLTAVNEGLLVWLVLAAGLVDALPAVGGAAFVIHFTLVWLAAWLTVNGPMRVFFLRWRFQGGRIA